MKNDLPLGKLIYNYIKKNGVNVSWLAKQMECDRKKLYIFFKTSYCDTIFLDKICYFLRCDCFVYYSKKLAENQITDKIL